MLERNDIIELLYIEREPVIVWHEHLISDIGQARVGGGGVALTELIVGGSHRDELLNATGTVSERTAGSIRSRPRWCSHSYTGCRRAIGRRGTRNGQ